MRTRTASSQRTYEEEFRERIARMEQSAQDAGTNMTEVCRLVGASRATPDRWKNQIPKTIRLVTQMEAIIAEKKALQERVKVLTANSRGT